MIEWTVTRTVVAIGRRIGPACPDRAAAEGMCDPASSDQGTDRMSQQRRNHAEADDGFPYVWTWRLRVWEFPGVRVKTSWFGDGIDRAGHPCRVLVRGSRNSALLEFDDGYRVVTSRAGLRRR